MSEVITLTSALINCPSITPNDAGCQAIIAQRLSALGFTIEHLRFGEVDNLWARKGTEQPLIVFAGHTDVVPPGPIEAWESNPFQATIRNGFLYGRGAADMKSGLSAMIIAAEKFIAANPNFTGSIGFLITSDEEGPTNENGTQRVIETLMARSEKINYCIIGEASSEEKVGDQIRVGRRGSLHGKLIIHGKQGHVAYPHLVNNPIHKASLALHELAETEWDQGNEFFPATSFQITNIHAGTGALNVTPNSLEICFNFRFSSALTVEELKQRVITILKKHHLPFDLTWNLSGSPFLTQPGQLISAAEYAIKSITGLSTKLSTSGGTSDGRFIAPSGAEVIELGPCHASIHQINECVQIIDVEILVEVYSVILKQLLLNLKTSFS